MNWLMCDEMVSIVVTEQPTKDPETGPMEIVLYHQPIKGAGETKATDSYKYILQSIKVL